MRLIKQGTWACVALLVGAEIFARSPLSTALKGDVDEQAVLQQRNAQTAGPANQLPGIRPFPSYYDIELAPKAPAAPPAAQPAAPAPPAAGSPPPPP